MHDLLCSCHAQQPRCSGQNAARCGSCGMAAMPRQRTARERRTCQRAWKWAADSGALSCASGDCCPAPAVRHSRLQRLKYAAKASRRKQASTGFAVTSPSRKRVDCQAAARSMQHQQQPTAPCMTCMHVAPRDSPNVEVLHVASAERAQEPPCAVSAQWVTRSGQALQPGRLQCLSERPAGLPASRIAPSFRSQSCSCLECMHMSMASSTPRSAML